MRPAQRLAGLVVGIVAPLLAAAQAPTVPPQATSVDGATTHLYKSIGPVELRLHVFTPRNHSASDGRAAVVFFFGGAWRTGNITQFVQQSRHLAERGMVSIVADYRVRGRHQTTPFEAIADAKSAIRWVRGHARTLGVDPQRIAAGGGSAGGHIALTAAVLKSFDEPSEDRSISSKPNALVLFNPVVDTANAEAFAGRGLEGSPLHNLTADLPPTLIQHGRADTLVPYSTVEQCCAKAKSLGATCELVGYDEAGHGFFNTPGPRWHEPTLAEADRFLTARGYLPKS